MLSGVPRAALQDEDKEQVTALNSMGYKQTGGRAPTKTETVGLDPPPLFLWILVPAQDRWGLGSKNKEKYFNLRRCTVGDSRALVPGCEDHLLGLKGLWYYGSATNTKTG